MKFKLKITSIQFKKLLENPDIKVRYPITLDLNKISKKEASEIIELLKKKTN